MLYGPTLTGAVAQKTSANTADVQTIAAPAGAVGCFITALTNAALLTHDGSAPTATNGIKIPAAGLPLFLPIGDDLKVASSNAAAASTVDVLWLAR